MDLVEQFAASTNPKYGTKLQDVKDYINWETDHGEFQFTPQITDDVAIRTYLLDCRIRGVSRTNLNRIASSLEHFYAWLKTSGAIGESPFEKFNLKRVFLDDKKMLPRHDAFPGLPDEREIARLRALNRLAESANQALDVQSLLNGTLETMLGVMTLNTAWISLKADSGLLGRPPDPPPEHGFVLAAARNLPPSLEKSNRYYLTRPPECHCQQLLRTGQLKQGVNVVECSRLQDAMDAKENNGGLMFHASVPIALNNQVIGVMNFAAEEWQLLSASDLQFLTMGAKQLGSALERAHLYDLIRIEQTRMEQELDLARKMQISLFPEEMPEIAGYSLAAFWQPAHETSGDYYNIFKLPGGRWGFIVADVAGKGAPAALRMAMAHSLIRERVENEPSPAALLTQVNRVLCEQDMDMQFVTSFYAILDPENANLKYAIAGHPPPFLREASGRVKTLPGRGIALGISLETDYEDISLALAPGDSLVAFTDGVTDANNPSHKSYDLAQFKMAIGSAPASAEALVNHLQSNLVDWVKEAPNYDDITILAIARKLP
ncbi:MAG: GAF domain-containing SpoIIE family protein phosphatase [Anaerolineales bacterium]|jgi:serine phosphatase RsbU (regulator of sigma subunit)